MFSYTMVYDYRSLLLSFLFQVYVAVGVIFDIDVILIFYVFDRKGMRLTWLPKKTVPALTRRNLPI